MSRSVFPSGFRAGVLRDGGAPPAARMAAYLIALGLVFHATFRGLYADLDAVIYNSWYLELSAIDADAFVPRLITSGWTFATRDDSLARFEWGFSLFGWLIGAMGLPVQAFFFLAASLSLLPKAYLAGKYTRHPVLSMLWYASFCYLLLEMNAMRAGIAAALMLLALVPLFKQQRGRYVLLVLLAAAFHTSAVFALGLLAYTRWCLTPNSLLVVVALALGLSFVDITSVLGLLGSTFQKIGEYKAAFDAGFGDVAYLLLNPLNLSSIAFLLAGLPMLLIFARNSKVAPHARVAIGLYFLPLIMLFALASFPIVAGRLSEVLCAYQMLTVVSLVEVLPGAMLGRALILGVSALQFYIQNFRTLNVDFFYFVGAPKPEMIDLIEQKIAIDAVLSSIFYNL